MSDGSQAMVKKIGLIGLVESSCWPQQDDLSLGAAGWRQLFRLACSVQEIGHG